jgi:hypothetical protein
MLKVAKLKNLAAVAILIYSDLSKRSAKLHQVFQDNSGFSRIETTLLSG